MAMCTTDYGGGGGGGGGGKNVSKIDNVICERPLMRIPLVENVYELHVHFLDTAVAFNPQYPFLQESQISKSD